MPSAKPRYDRDGSWKYAQYSKEEWDTLTKRLQEKLKKFYPEKNPQICETFGHPADEWVSVLLNEARGAISMMLWLRLRLTRAELHAERSNLLTRLKNAQHGLSNISHDLDIMLGVDADILGCRDQITDIINRVEATKSKITQLPQAAKLRDAQNEAAIEMAIRVLRALKNSGISMAATAEPNSQYFSEAISILKILGDELKIQLSEATWKTIIGRAKQNAEDLKVRKTPKNLGA